MKARAFWAIAPGEGEIRTEILPEPAPGEQLLACLASGISRGTESLVFAGQVPPAQYSALHAPLMGGHFPFPVKFGNAAVALTEEGKRVFVLHPHQDRFLAPAEMCIPVPEALPTQRAVLAANMEAALNISWDALPMAGERILIIGAGVLGLLSGWILARTPGAEVTVVDINPARAGLASAMGCRFCAPEHAPADQDLIVHASATEEGLRLALDRAGFEARILEASWFGTNAPAVPLGEAFHARRLRLIGTHAGRTAPTMRGRRSRTQRLAMALEMLADPVFDSVLEPTTPFEELPEAMPRLLAGGLCHVVTYPAA